MARKKIDLRRNADGTITAIYGTDKASFMDEPWYTDEDRQERAKWEFIQLGVAIKYAEEERDEI